MFELSLNVLNVGFNESGDGVKFEDSFEMAVENRDDVGDRVVSFGRVGGVALVDSLDERVESAAHIIELAIDGFSKVIAVFTFGIGRSGLPILPEVADSLAQRFDHAIKIFLAIIYKRQLSV